MGEVLQAGVGLDDEGVPHFSQQLFLGLDVSPQVVLNQRLFVDLFEGV